jgi:hypothetical protein
VEQQRQSGGPLNQGGESGLVLRVGNRAALLRLVTARSSISGCTGHNSHREQASLIRRYVIGRNKHLTDAELRKSIRRAGTLKRAKDA